MDLFFYAVTLITLMAIGYAATPLRRYAVLRPTGVSLRRYAVTPLGLHRCRLTPLRHYAAWLTVALRPYAATPLRRYAVTPLRRSG